MKATTILLLSAMAPVSFAQRPVSLDDAIKAARETSPSVQMAKADAAAARQKFLMYRARLAPQVSINGFATDSKPGTILQSSPGSMPGAVMGMPPGENWAANVMLMLPLFTGGKLQAEASAALAEERAAKAQLAEMQSEAALMVEEAYLMALLAEAMVQTEDARVAAAEEMVRTMQARFEAGSEIEASVRRAEAELAMAKRERAKAANERSKAVLEVLNKMGADLSERIELTGALDAEQSSISLDEWIRVGKSDRGRLAAARAMRDAAKQRVRAAEGTKLPQVYAQAMNDSSNDSMMRGRTYAITFSMPLFDAGERRAEANQMRSMLSAAEQQLKLEELAVETDIRKAWLDLETAASNAASARASVAAAEAGLEVVRLRVSAGKSILLEQLDAVQMLRMARQELAQAIFDQRLALARLKWASGATNGGSSR